MAIERVSRYNDGPLAQTKYENTGGYAISVYRKWPENKVVNFFNYTWVDGDSLGRLAYDHCGGSKYWWEIMDINPEITDPMELEPGMVIRIPNE